MIFDSITKTFPYMEEIPDWEFWSCGEVGESCLQSPFNKKRIPLSEELPVCLVISRVAISAHMLDVIPSASEPATHCLHRCTHFVSGLSRICGDDMQRQTFEPVMQRLIIDQERIICGVAREI
jgi:hypothetical protein